MGGWQGVDAANQAAAERDKKRRLLVLLSALDTYLLMSSTGNRENLVKALNKYRED